jgi:hypothetical protein
VCLFRCEGASPEIPEISPEIPDFPETPEKSPEYPGFTDKFVLSGDFHDSPIHPPLGEIKILSKIMCVLLLSKVRITTSKMLRRCSRGGVPQACPTLKK